MVMSHVLLFLHLVGMVLLVAGVASSTACKATALRSSSPQVICELLLTASRAARLLVLPGSFLLLFTGIWLVAGSNGSYVMTAPWIVGTIVAWLTLLVVEVALHAPRGRGAREFALALGADDAGVVPSELHHLIRGDCRIAGFDVLLLVLMVTLMVFKPG